MKKFRLFILIVITLFCFSGIWLSMKAGQQSPPYQYRSVLYPDAQILIPNFDTTDILRQFNTQPAGNLHLVAPIGAVSDGDRILFRIRTVNKQHLVWHPGYDGTGDCTLPEVTSGSNHYDHFLVVYNEDNNRWVLLAKSFGE